MPSRSSYRGPGDIGEPVQLARAAGEHKGGIAPVFGICIGKRRIPQQEGNARFVFAVRNGKPVHTVCHDGKPVRNGVSVQRSTAAVEADLYLFGIAFSVADTGYYRPARSEHKGKCIHNAVAGIIVMYGTADIPYNGKKFIGTKAILTDIARHERRHRADDRAGKACTGIESVCGAAVAQDKHGKVFPGRDDIDRFVILRKTAAFAVRIAAPDGDDARIGCRVAFLPRKRTVAAVSGRRNDYAALGNGIIHRPLFGCGIGITADGYIYDLCARIGGKVDRRNEIGGKYAALAVRDLYRQNSRVPCKSGCAEPVIRRRRDYPGDLCPVAAAVRINARRAARRIISGKNIRARKVLVLPRNAGIYNGDGNAPAAGCDIPHRGNGYVLHARHGDRIVCGTEHLARKICFVILAHPENTLKHSLIPAGNRKNTRARVRKRNIFGFFQQRRDFGTRRFAAKADYIPRAPVRSGGFIGNSDIPAQRSSGKRGFPNIVKPGKNVRARQKSRKQACRR